MTLTVTSAGLAASLDAAEKGIKLKIKKIGFGSAGYVPNKDQTSLKAEFLRTEFTDSSISSKTLNMGVVFDDLNQSFDAREIGYYLEDETLFAVDSLDGDIISSKHKGSILTESFELVLSDHLIDSITVDVIGVSRATEANVGIAKIATINEAFDVENDVDIVTPKKMHDVLDERVVNPNLLINGCFSINQRYAHNQWIDAVEGSVGYFADRWVVRSIHRVGGVIQYKTDHNGGTAAEQGGGSRMSAKFSGAESFWSLHQRVEMLGYDMQDILGKELTISFRMYSSEKIRVKAGCVFLTTAGGPATNVSDGSFSDYFLVSGMQDCSVTVRMPDSLYSGVLMNNLILQIYIEIAGVSSTAVPDATVEFFYAKAELGSVATKFEPDSIATNLMKCQRYFFRGVTRGAASAYTPSLGFLPSAHFNEMRIVPVITVETVQYRLGSSGDLDIECTPSFPTKSNSGFLAQRRSGANFDYSTGGYGTVSFKADAEI